MKKPIVSIARPFHEEQPEAQQRYSRWLNKTLVRRCQRHRLSTAQKGEGI